MDDIAISNKVEFEKSLKACPIDKLDSFRKYIIWTTRKINDNEFGKCDTNHIIIDMNQKMEVANWIIPKGKAKPSQTEISLNTLPLFFKNIREHPNYETFKKNPFSVPRHSDGSPLFDPRFIIEDIKEKSSKNKKQNIKVETFEENKYNGPMLDVFVKMKITSEEQFEDYMSRDFSIIRKNEMKTK
jgi:hypothetical protein